MDKQIISFFKRVDPTLYVITKKTGIRVVKPRSPKDYFVSLCEEIIGQQLSGKVADVLFDRFEKLFPKRHVTPERVLKLTEETLRSTGMSWSKARFIRDLAHHVDAKLVQLDQLSKLPDEEVIRELTKIKGIGPWTAEMFLMFTLGREDVFSYGDLGLRRAIQKLYTLKKEPTIKQMEELAHTWKPFRTYAARILWRSLELQ